MDIEVVVSQSYTIKGLIFCKPIFNFSRYIFSFRVAYITAKDFNLLASFSQLNRQSTVLSVEINEFR